ncbi:hypothetical protein S7711_11112 [Stachybotrys chartarum IBT 7711]|uniref:Uncharacterized protein n=1 Tax=Stachybotrys chartarum (strain CBS 109288 / IBT 7711) TaxID=1280523 RepID=A0A084ASM2_STACB|nr:hypothetical protein S7711_11112 [Stachybotrys chartarum IBT 7711]
MLHKYFPSLLSPYIIYLDSKGLGDQERRNRTFTSATKLQDKLNELRENHEDFETAKVLILLPWSIATHRLIIKSTYISLNSSTIQELEGITNNT